jgi:hypothetical protein
MIPPGRGPFPVFLTNQPRSHGWVAPAVRRGYIGGVYYATDPIYGNGDDSDGYIDIYPDYDFSCLARWAWAGMRAVDYLYTLPEVDKNKIAISGHSRNGKQALLAGAFDDRIAAVIPSSGNTGEADPWRYTSDMFVNESLEQITGNFPYWFHPRLRFFAGREDKLARLAFADDFGGGLEDTHQFFGYVRVAAEDPLFGLPHHLLDSRHKGVQFFAQPFQGGLLHHLRGSFHPFNNLARKPFGLACHASYRGQEFLVSLLQAFPIRPAPGACDPPNFQNAKLHAPAPVTELGSLLPGDVGDSLHRAD